MDKETLSNYGWIVIAVLVLAVMIALATPFGNFIANSIKATTQGLFDTSYNALEAVNVPGLAIEKQDIDTAKKQLIEFQLIPVSKQDIVYTYKAEANMTWGDWIDSKYNVDGLYILDDEIRHPFEPETDNSVLVLGLIMSTKIETLDDITTENSELIPYSFVKSTETISDITYYLQRGKSVNVGGAGAGIGRPLLTAEDRINFVVSKGYYLLRDENGNLNITKCK